MAGRQNSRIIQVVFNAGKDLEQFLLKETQRRNGEPPEIINIYPRGSQTVCWFFFDTSPGLAQVKPMEVFKPKIKKTKVKKK
jgi:hypothetical protein